MRQTCGQEYVRIPTVGRKLISLVIFGEMKRGNMIGKFRCRREKAQQFATLDEAQQLATLDEAQQLATLTAMIEFDRAIDMIK